MGTYPAGAVTRLDLGLLLDPPPRSTVTGPLRWGIKSRPEGKVDVEAWVPTVDGAWLRISYPLGRPWMVALGLFGNGVPLRRVCVNGHTRRVAGPCHMHTYSPADGSENAEALEGFPLVEPHAPIADVPYRDMLEAFAVLAGVDLSGLQWVDPPDVVGGAA